MRAERRSRRGPPRSSRPIPGRAYRVKPYPVRSDRDRPYRVNYERFGTAFIGVQRGSPAHSPLFGGYPCRYHGAAFGRAGQHSGTFSRSRGRRRGRGAGGGTPTGRVGRGRVPLAERRAVAPDQSGGTASQSPSVRLRVSGAVRRSAIHDPALGGKQPASADSQNPPPVVLLLPPPRPLFQ